VAAAVLLHCPFVEAVVLANYGFGIVDLGTIPPFTWSLASSDTDPSSTASSFGWGSGLTPTQCQGSPPFETCQGNPPYSAFVTYEEIDGTDQSGAVSSDDYFSFSITPGPGVSLDITSLSFDTSVTNDAIGTPNSPTLESATYFARSSLTGTSTLGSFTRNATASGTGESFSPTTFILGQPSLQDVTGPIEFRIYLHDNGNIRTNFGVRIDNVSLEGVAVVSSVPEPATWLLLGTGLAGLVAWRRRR
jgi:hypothetical protein